MNKVGHGQGTTLNAKSKEDTPIWYELFNNFSQRNTKGIIMLLNATGHQVKISDKLNSVTHPKVFANLKEVLEPSPKFIGSLYRMDQRAKIVTK